MTPPAASIRLVYPVAPARASNRLTGQPRFDLASDSVQAGLLRGGGSHMIGKSGGAAPANRDLVKGFPSTMSDDYQLSRAPGAAMRLAIAKTVAITSIPFELRQSAVCRRA